MPANSTPTVDLWSVIAWTMVHFLWTGGLLWGLASMARRLTRRFSPGARYGIALFTLGSAVGLAGLLAGRIATNGSLLSNGTLTMAEVSVIPVDTGPEPAPLSPAALSQSPSAMALPATSPTVAGRRWEFVTPILARCLRFLPWVWISGSSLVALLFAGGLLRTVQMRTGSEPILQGPTYDALQALRVRLKIRRTVALAVSSRTIAPIVIGIVRPVILVPPSILTGLSPAQIEMILLHELAHVRRWDNLINLLQRAAESLLFFHPLVWWASRWARLERELCCDAVVLAHHGDRQRYAETLASLALPELAPQYAVAAMANHQLVMRIRRILNAEETSMPFTASSFAWSVAMLAATAIAGFVGFDVQARTARAAGQQTDEESHGENGADSAPIGTPLELWGHKDERSASSDAINHALQFLSAQNNPDAEPQLRELGLATAGIDAGHPEGWAPVQATGAPNVPTAGDDQRAWASQTEDDSGEWLLVGYEQPIHAAAILVYETFNPGALVKIVRLGEDGSETTLWEGMDPVSRGQDSGVAAITISSTAPVQYLRLHFDSPNVPGWNEVDAVGLIDRQSGAVHWAKQAAASSTYGHVTNPHFGAAFLDCTKCHSNVSAQEQLHLRLPAHPTSTHELLWRFQGGAPQASDRSTRIRQLEAELELLRRLDANDTWRGSIDGGSGKDESIEVREDLLDASDRWEQALDTWEELEDGGNEEGSKARGDLREEAAGGRDRDRQVLDEVRRALDEQQKAIERLNQLLQSIAPNSEGAEVGTPDEESNVDGNAADRSFLEQYFESNRTEADPVALRRFLLDLTGLPPSEFDEQRLSSVTSRVRARSELFDAPGEPSVQLHIQQPTTMEVVVVDTNETITVPGRLNLSTGKSYTLQFTNIPGHPGQVLNASVEVVADDPLSKVLLAHNAVPVSFTSEDIEQVASNNLVTRVLYLRTEADSPTSTLEQIISTRLDPGMDPVEEAKRRGVVIAVLRLGNRDKSGF